MESRGLFFAPGVCRGRYSTLFRFNVRSSQDHPVPEHHRVYRPLAPNRVRQQTTWSKTRHDQKNGKAA